MILVVGGSKDESVEALAAAARDRGFSFRTLFTDQAMPKVSWQPQHSYITIDGDNVDASDASLFIRYDVFGGVQQDNDSWYQTFKGWAQANPQVFSLNRGSSAGGIGKPCALVWARQAGFDVPDTWITNDFNQFAAREAYIAKPVGGGAYTRLLSQVEDTGRPWIVQERLEYPEMRLFRVGGHYFAFVIRSNMLDYREDSQGYEMTETEPPADLVSAMRNLTERMSLDYAAVDLKTCPRTGKLMFLEINTMPMFAGYDCTARGRLSDAMVLALRRLAL